jgi:hypothetical protein
LRAIKSGIVQYKLRAMVITQLPSSPIAGIEVDDDKPVWGWREEVQVSAADDIEPVPSPASLLASFDEIEFQNARGNTL